MPGPGGGSRGGGFGGGGFGGGFGGGHGPGGFGGGPGGFGPHGPHGPHHHRGFRGPRFFWGPRFYGGPHYYGGGGCLGGFFGLLFLSIIFIVISAMVLLFTLSDAITAFRKGGIVQYDERAFQDYANECYYEEFGSSSAFEDNLMIVFLTDEECDEFYCSASTGNHIATQVNYMFGDETTEFGRTVYSSVNAEYYGYSLSSNLKDIVESMKGTVTKLGLESYHSCNEEHVQVESRVSNRTSLRLDEATVNAALTDFTAATEIPICIVVDEMEDVFGKTMPLQYVIILLIAAAVLVIGIVMIVRAVKNRKKGDDGPSNGNRYTDGQNNTFH